MVVNPYGITYFATGLTIIQCTDCGSPQNAEARIFPHASGRHFLQIPGPSPVPDRILRAISLPTIDHRGPEFAVLGREVLDGIRDVFRTRHPVIIYPASGTGAWEAALVNTLSPGDRVLMVETGQFAALWQRLATRLGLEPELMVHDGVDPVLPQASGWRRGVDAGRIESRLRADPERTIKAVCVVHNETSTGVTSDIAAVRRALDAAGHPALLMVDTISGLASADYRHDDWGVDVAISGSQKGLMLPPGISFNALSPRALEANRHAGFGRSYWAWDEMLAFNGDGYFPYTPNTNLLYGLAESLTCCPKKDSTTCSPATGAGLPGCARRSRPGDCRSSAPIRRSTHRCLPASSRPKASMPIPSARRSTNASTCRSAPAWARSRAGCSASATSATSTT